MLGIPLLHSTSSSERARSYSPYAIIRNRLSMWVVLPLFEQMIMFGFRDHTDSMRQS